MALRQISKLGSVDLHSLIYIINIHTDPSLVAWRSAVYEPPEEGFMRDKGQMLSVLV